VAVPQRRDDEERPDIRHRRRSRRTPVGPNRPSPRPRPGRRSARSPRRPG